MEPAEAHEPEARAVALLGMRAVARGCRRRAGRWPGRSVRPTRSGATASIRRAPDAPAACASSCVENRPRPVRRTCEATRRPLKKTSTVARREARLDPRVHELIRHAVEVVVDLDVIVDVDATRLPLRQLVARARQGLERRPIELLEERAPADAGDLHRAVVDGVDPLANGGVQIGEREEGAVPQRRQDPALRDLDTDFDFGFVGRRARRARESPRRRSGGRARRRSG